MYIAQHRRPWLETWSLDRPLSRLETIAVGALTGLFLGLILFLAI